MNKYILIGIPSCGKTTLGKRAADILQLPFYDTDRMACEKMGDFHPFEMIKMSFKERFYREQKNAVEELYGIDGAAIIATGAEVALIRGCDWYLRSMGIIIHIKRSPEIILANMPNNEKSHLILKNVDDGSEINLQKESIIGYAKAMSHYDMLADIIMENDGSEDEGIEKLLAIIRGELC